MTEYVVITRDDCLYCEAAKELLENLGLPYMVVNLQHKENKWVLALIKSSGFKTVPQIYDPTGAHVGGYTELEEGLLRSPYK